MSAGFVIAILISGLVTGGLARLAVPGPDPMPLWLTLAIGLTGSIAGAVLGDVISGGNGYAVSFLSLGVAIALVVAYRHFVQRRPIFGPGALRFPERGLGVEQARDHAALAVAERSLAELREDVGDRAPGGRLDLGVGIPEGHDQRAGQTPPDAALADAHEADEGDGLAV